MTACRRNSQENYEDKYLLLRHSTFTHTHTHTHTHMWLWVVSSKLN
jgi:hypothetical protein